MEFTSYNQLILKPAGLMTVAPGPRAHGRKALPSVHGFH